MVYLPSDKAAWAILSELNMCVYTYTKMKWLDFLTKTGWNARTCKSCYLLFVKYMQEKIPSDILEPCWEKAKVFEKSFQMWKCLKWKITQYTVIAVWFLYDVQNYADLRWPSFYSIQFASSFASYSTSLNNLCPSLKLNWVTMVNTLYSCTCTYFL